MEFFIDEQKKNLYERKIAGHVKRVKTLRLVAKFFILLGALSAGIYGLLSFLIPSFAIITVNGVPKKDVECIVNSVLFIIIFYLGLSKICRLLADVFEVGFGVNRVDERISVADGVVKYTYSMNMNPKLNRKTVVTFHLNTISEASWDSSENLLRLYGDIIREECKNCSANQSGKIGQTDCLVIHDYFSPSFMGWLAENKVEIYGYNSEE